MFAAFELKLRRAQNFLKIRRFPPESRHSCAHYLYTSLLLCLRIVRGGIRCLGLGRSPRPQPSPGRQRPPCFPAMQRAVPGARPQSQATAQQSQATAQPRQAEAALLAQHRLSSVGSPAVTGCYRLSGQLCVLKTGSRTPCTCGYLPTLPLPPPPHSSGASGVSSVGSASWPYH